MGKLLKSRYRRSKSPLYNDDDDGDDDDDDDDDGDD